jgi:predicted transcriptional regulator of viral defense system
MNLERIDNLTLKHKFFLESVCTVKERALVVHLVDNLPLNSLTFAVKNIKNKVRIEQHSVLSVLLGRLCEKKVLERIERGLYKFLELDLVEYIEARCLGKR